MKSLYDGWNMKFIFLSPYTTLNFAQHVNYFWSDEICSHLEIRKKRTFDKMFKFQMSFFFCSGMKIVLNVKENGTNHKLHEQTGDIKHSMHQKKR